jgi:hypothetical protein
LAQPVADFAAVNEFNRALDYAASRPNYIGGQGLMYPFKSWVFRNMIARSQVIATRMSVWLTADLAIAQAVYSEFDAGMSGRCR